MYSSSDNSQRAFRRPGSWRKSDGWLSLLSALVLLIGAPVSAKQTTDSEAIAFATPYLKSRLKVCDGKTFAWLTHYYRGTNSVLAELKSPKITSLGNKADNIEQLNGVDYRARISVKFDAFRLYDFSHKIWEKWADPSGYMSGIDVTPHMRVIHENGTWKHDNRDKSTSPDWIGISSEEISCDQLPK